MNKDSQQLALDYLTEGLRKGVWRRGERLPTVSALAKSLKVSTAAMSSALGELCRTGQLEAKRRSGIFVPTPLQFPKTTTSVSKWTKTAALLRQDILGGTFATSGLLPRLTDLSKRYGVCTATMKKAIADVFQSGMLIAQKSRYRIQRHADKTFSAVIVYIGISNEQGVVSLDYERLREIVQTLKKECYDSRIHFFVEGIANSEKSVASLIKTIEKSYDGAIGFIVSSFGVAPQYLETIIEYLGKKKRPVALFDADGQMVPPPLWSALNLRVFSPAGEQAGRQIARYLLNLNHRDIAYLSPFHSDGWSIYRQRGLQQVCRESGGRIRLHSITAAFSDDHFFVSPDNLRPDSPAGTTIKKLMPYMQQLSGEYTNLFLPHISTILGSMAGILHLERMRVVAHELFREAIKTGNSTAWVLANDGLAILAREFLRTHTGIKTPRTLLVGFDDSMVAHSYNLSSYNFDFAGIARRMLAFIIDPASVRITHPEIRIECEGFLTER